MGKKKITMSKRDGKKPGRKQYRRSARIKMRKTGNASKGKVTNPEVSSKVSSGECERGIQVGPRIDCTGRWQGHPRWKYIDSKKGNKRRGSRTSSGRVFFIAAQRAELCGWGEFSILWTYEHGMNTKATLC